MRINDKEYTDNEFMQTYYKVYGDNAGLDDKEAYIDELKDYAGDSLEDIITKHGIDNGYIA